MEKEIKLRRYIDYKFNGIDCMISDDGKELGFFKNSNDIRPSQATYIKKEDAEHLYKVFMNWETFKKFQNTKNSNK